MTTLRFYAMICNPPTLSIICIDPQGIVGNTAAADITLLHLITLIALKRVEEDSAEPLKGEGVTGSIWEKPCNLNYGYRSGWLACIQSLWLVLQSPPSPLRTVSVTNLLKCQIDAQTSAMISAANYFVFRLSWCFHSSV